MTLVEVKLLYGLFILSLYCFPFWFPGFEFG